MKTLKSFDVHLFEKIFDLNSKNKIGANTIAVFTFILYKCEDLQKEIELSDYEMARELDFPGKPLSLRKNKLKLLGLLDYKRNPGFPNRFILKGIYRQNKHERRMNQQKNQLINQNQFWSRKLLQIIHFSTIQP
jgi:hypothetical protein